MNEHQICSIVKFTKNGITVEILLTAPNPDYAKKIGKLLGYLTQEAHTILDQKEGQ
jgi:hypothetical protein